MQRINTLEKLMLQQLYYQPTENSSTHRDSNDKVTHAWGDFIVEYVIIGNDLFVLGNSRRRTAGF